jgi:hypothetical protein
MSTWGGAGSGVGSSSETLHTTLAWGSGNGEGALHGEDVPLLLTQRVLATPERKITWWQLTALAYVMVAGGPFGYEEAVLAAGALPVLVATVAVTILYAIPQCLFVAELAALFDVNGGFVVVSVVVPGTVFVSRGCGCARASAGPLSGDTPPPHPCSVGTWWPWSLLGLCVRWQRYHRKLAGQPPVRAGAHSLTSHSLAHCSTPCPQDPVIGTTPPPSPQEHRVDGRVLPKRVPAHAHRLRGVHEVRCGGGVCGHDS